jgi:hypothetical protein
MAKKGCGCIVVGVSFVAVATLSALVAASWYVKSTFDTLDDSPKPLPVPEISEETESKISSIDERLTAIFERGEAGTVSISNELINPWLRMNRNADLRFLGEHTWIDLSGERVKAQIATPLAPVGIDGKFFNGALTVSGWLRTGKVRFFLHDISVDGRTGERTAWIAQVIAGRDWAEQLSIEPLIDVEFRHRCTVEIRTSQVIIECSAKST